MEQWFSKNGVQNSKHQHHLETIGNASSQTPQPVPTESETLKAGSAIHVSKSPLGDFDAYGV
jgi:hypothetical protein